MLPPPEVVYQALSDGLASVLEALRFNRVRRVPYPTWRSTVDDAGSIFFSLQVDPKATDPFSGGGFRIELERSAHSRPARGLNGRALFFQLMTADELRVLLDHQDRVIASLPAPPAAQVELYPEGLVREQYLRYFQPQPSFDVIYCWLRFMSVDDVEGWARVLTPMVEPMVDSARDHLDPDRRHLGKGNLLPASG